MRRNAEIGLTVMRVEKRSRYRPGCRRLRNKPKFKARESPPSEAYWGSTPQQVRDEAQRRNRAFGFVITVPATELPAAP